MTMIPDEELNPRVGVNLAPLIDFLFIVLAVFAIIAITRAALFDTEINLAQLKKEEISPLSPSQERYTVVLSVNKEGNYKWITESSEFLIQNCDEVQKQLSRQQELGLLPWETDKIKILLHIDRQAQWEPIVELIFKVRELGFAINPVYEPLD